MQVTSIYNFSTAGPHAKGSRTCPSTLHQQGSHQPSAFGCLADGQTDEPRPPARAERSDTPTPISDNLNPHTPFKFQIWGSVFANWGFSKPIHIFQNPKSDTFPVANILQRVLSPRYTSSSTRARPQPAPQAHAQPGVSPTLGEMNFLVERQTDRSSILQFISHTSRAARAAPRQTQEPRALPTGGPGAEDKLELAAFPGTLAGSRT